MMTGHVNSRLEAVIALKVYESSGAAREIEAVIDTGYAGYLTLPSAVIGTLGLGSLGLSYLTLADRSEVLSDVYQAAVEWDGQTRTIVVDTLESEALVGMALLRAAT
jgi:clan AA aspartic protease